MEDILRSKSTSVALISVAVAAAMALTACGGSDDEAASPAAPPASTPAASASPSAAGDNGVAALAADEILKRAQTALKQVDSFRAKGVVNQDDQKTNLDLKVSGDDFAATLGIDKAEVDLLAVGGKKYLRPNEQFFVMSTNAQQGKALAQVINDRWIIGADKDSSFKDLFTVADMQDLLKPTGKVSKGEQTEVDGIPVITLKDAGDADSALYIATTGEPYPVQLASKGGSKLTFSKFGEKFTDITKPATKDVVDLNSLTGGK
jgi:hypothetical protein